MTELSIDPLVIKKTQESLGKFVKKPSLSEKLLKKPPFRFLHDVISAIIRDSGTFSELYSNDELTVENIKDREGKINFLQKIIDVVNISTKSNLTVRASKIVAGHEPEKTNELLQCIGLILENKIDCKEAIETVINGGVPKQKTKTKEDKLEKNSKTKSDKSVKKSTDVKEKQRISSKEKVKEKSTAKIVKAPSTESDKGKRDEKNKSNNRNTQVKRESSKDSTPDKNKKTEDKVRKSKKSDEIPKPEEKRRRSSTLKENKKESIDKSEQRKENDVESLVVANAPPSAPTSLQENNKLESQPESIKAEEILLPAVLETQVNRSPKTFANENDRKTSAAKNRPESKARKSSADTNLSEDPSLSGEEFRSLDVVAPRSLEKIQEIDTRTINPLATIESGGDNLNGQSEVVQRQSTFVREETNISLTGRPRTSLRPPSARPASARPGAPRRRDKNVEIILQPNDQVKLGSVNVKLETFNAELEDDGETLVIIENATNVDESSPVEHRQNESMDNDMVQQGHLVQQILETQMELVHTNELQGAVKSEKDFENNNTAQHRQSSARQQVDTLKDIIQILTKSVNPLGKLMDFIPEDIDSMQLELTMWRDNYTQSASELRKEKNLTEFATEPMKIQLTQIEVSIKEYQEMIELIRSKIIQNSEKIHRLLTEQ